MSKYLSFCFLFLLFAVSQGIAESVNELLHNAEPLSLEQKKELVYEIINEEFNLKDIPEIITGSARIEFNRKKAVKYLLLLTEQFPYSKYYNEALYIISDYYFAIKDYQNAKIYFEKYVSKAGIGAKTLEARFKLGLIYKEEKNYGKALSMFHKVLDLYSMNEFSYKAYENIADCYKLQGNRKKVIVTYENVSGYFNDVDIISKSLLQVAKLYMDEGNYFEAIWNLNKIVQRYTYSKSYFESLYYLAMCYGKTGELAKEQEILKKVIEDHSFDNEFGDEALYALGDSYYKNGSFKDSSAAYFSALKSYPNYPKANDAVYYLAKSCLELGISDMAIENFEKLIDTKLDKNRKNEICYMLCKLYYNDKDYQKAVDICKGFTLPHDYEIEEQYYTGMSLFYLEQYRSSFEAFLNLEHQNKDVVMQVRGVFMLGQILVKLNKFDSATHYFDATIEIIDTVTTDDPSVREKKEEKVSLSVEDEKLLLEVKTEALFALGKGYFDEKKFSESAEKYQKIAALEISSSDRAWVLYKIGKCYEHAKDYDKAQELYLQLKNEYPEFNISEQASWDLKNIEWNKRFSKVKNM